jgi:pantoate--beta-alanine ligase
MVEDLHVPVDVHIYPTVRGSDGLALSSRNRYLDPAERQAALALYCSLQRAQQAVAAGQRDAERVRQILRDTLESQPLVRVDYVEVADADTLEPLSELKSGGKAVALVAARVGRTRLIDNAILVL